MPTIRTQQQPFSTAEELFLKNKTKQKNKQQPEIMWVEK